VRPAGPPSWPFPREDIRAALEKAYRDGAWGAYHGPATLELAQAIASLHGKTFVELCASGTAAVELALRGCGVQPEDEVILAGYDFKGNLSNVLAVGARPVLVDLDPGNWNLAVDQLEDALSPRSKGLIVSHLHGGVVPMQRLLEVTRAAGLWVIEDACQMPGAQLGGKAIGSWGDVGIWSFGGSKLLAAGRGGALFTNDEAIAQRIRLHCQRGNHAYPLSELQASVLLPQLMTLDADNRRRRDNVTRLIASLGEGLQPFQNTVADAAPGYYKLGFQYDPAFFAGMPRDLFVQAMRAEGIALDAGFRALHLSHARRRFRGAGELTQAGRADEAALVLHHPVLLEDAAAIEQIARAVEKIRTHAESIVAEHTG
jgi:dTDP-4-amino-4,6-dideoxygalactose transaminase